VSRKYAQEIQTPEYGTARRRDARRADYLTGILNGVDYAAWNPEKDKLIAAKYSIKDMSGKLTCKKNLLEVFHLPPETVSQPLIGIVSRFADQKGFDLIAKVGAGPARRRLGDRRVGSRRGEIRKGASRPGQEVP